MIRGSDLDFSYWPIKGVALQPRVYASDPWPILRQVVQRECQPGHREAAARFLEQAEDYFTASTNARVLAARPLLFYYCLLNLVKAFILTRSMGGNLDGARHGLIEKPLQPGEREFRDARLGTHLSSPAHPSIFTEFLSLLDPGQRPQAATLTVTALAPQIVAGHRLWSSVSSRNHERFIQVKRIEFVRDRVNRSLWLRMYLDVPSITRLRATAAQLLTDGGLAPDWRQVQISEPSKAVACYEQTVATPYSVTPAEVVPDVVHELRQHLWATVTSVRPYRSYYLNMCGVSELTSLLSQLASIYAVAFYLGSITRYRPHHFQSILRGTYGPWVENFLHEQPSQFLYLLASDFARQDVASNYYSQS